MEWIRPGFQGLFEIAAAPPGCCSCRAAHRLGAVAVVERAAHALQLSQRDKGVQHVCRQAGAGQGRAEIRRGLRVTAGRSHGQRGGWERAGGGARGYDGGAVGEALRGRWRPCAKTAVAPITHPFASRAG